MRKGETLTNTRNGVLLIRTLSEEEQNHSEKPELCMYTERWAGGSGESEVGPMHVGGKDTNLGVVFTT